MVELLDERKPVSLVCPIIQLNLIGQELSFNGILQNNK